MNEKKFLSLIILLINLVLGCILTINLFIDPYFHYHKPSNNMNYYLYNQRYQNDGILRNFDYDAVIIGTSMVENTKSSQVDELFSVNSVKTCLSGASFKEVNDRLITAFNNNKNIKLVIRGLDLSKFLDDKDYMRYDKYSFPEYLYDNVIYNDIYYLLNKDVLFNDTIVVIEKNIKKEKTTSFDEYSNWSNDYVFSKNSVDLTYIRSKKTNISNKYNAIDYKNEILNLYQNVISIAIENPETQFYYFITPYSIYYYDDLNQTGDLKKVLYSEQVAIEEIIKHKNIKLFSINNCFDIITNLNNYKDIWHYNDKINELIITSMKDEKHMITKDNYLEYITEVYNFYTNFDYDNLFKNE